MLMYLAGLRSHHMDRNLPLSAFDSPRLQQIIKGRRRLFPHSKSKRLPTSQDFLSKITSTAPKNIDEFNIDAAFKVAWAGFLRLGEITYTRAQSIKPAFVDTRPTRSDVVFAENDQYTVLRLKRSKTDMDHAGRANYAYCNRRQSLPSYHSTTSFGGGSPALKGSALPTRYLVYSIRGGQRDEKAVKPEWCVAIRLFRS